jgi:hypothetical protein
MIVPGLYGFLNTYINIAFWLYSVNRKNKLNRIEKKNRKEKGKNNKKDNKYRICPLRRFDIFLQNSYRTKWSTEHNNRGFMSLTLLFVALKFNAGFYCYERL